MEHEKLRLMLPWEEIEDGAQKQILNILELPFLRVLAIMPDVHQGYLLPIGGVARLWGVISPEMVGYDIGCGMTHCEIPVRVDTMSEEELKNLRDLIKQHIPMGFNGHSKPQKNKFRLVFDSASHDTELNGLVKDKLESSFGTLGGGNHFIELGESRNTGNLGITIHSGSRGPGWKVAEYWMKKSKDVDTELPDGFLRLHSEYGQGYYSDMCFMLHYAMENRWRMMSNILNALRNHAEFDRAEVERNMINENHNHAELEHARVLHRKGATPAEEGRMGVIPGNMRDGVYITRGLGNRDFLESASHGAGRVASRTQARKKCDMDVFINQMEGIIWDESEKLKDENPNAYKDLDTVVGYQEGIVVDILDKFSPVVNLKG